MTRIDILHDIELLITGHCHGCDNRIFRGALSKADMHCSKVCPIGARLQEQGRLLMADMQARRIQKMN